MIMENNYVVLNGICMADIRLALLVYLHCLRLQVLRAYCIFASKQAISITLFGPRPKKNWPKKLTHPGHPIILLKSN